MSDISRRAFLRTTLLGSAVVVGACSGTTQGGNPGLLRAAGTPAVVPPGVDPQYAMIYGSVEGERFPVPAVNLSKIDPAFLRTEVAYSSSEAPGTIVVDPAAHYL